VRCGRRRRLILSSTNINRERIYVQQPPISGERAFSGQAFAPHFAHTVRRSEDQDLRRLPTSRRPTTTTPIMAQLLLLGTNTVQLRRACTPGVGLGRRGLEAVRVTEWDEPQAVFGSYLQEVRLSRLLQTARRARTTAKLINWRRGQGPS